MFEQRKAHSPRAPAEYLLQFPGGMLQLSCISLAKVEWPSSRVWANIVNMQHEGEGAIQRRTTVLVCRLGMNGATLINVPAPACRAFSSHPFPGQRAEWLTWSTCGEEMPIVRIKQSVRSKRHSLNRQIKHTELAPYGISWGH